MNTLQIQPLNSVKVNFIIHEKGDEFFLLNCVCNRNNKEYFSNIPISCNAFYKILNLLVPNFIDQFSNKLFNSEFPINEVSPKEIIKTDLYLDFNDVVQPVQNMKICA